MGIYSIRVVRMVRVGAERKVPLMPGVYRVPQDINPKTARSLVALGVAHPTMPTLETK